MRVSTLNVSLLLLLIARVAATAIAHTAVLFGASGAVGSEVLHALLRQPFWEEIILVGRRLPAFDDNNTTKVVTRVILPDLGAVDRNESLSKMRADACFIAVGAGHPHRADLRYWHSVEVEMPAAMARLCREMQARYIALLSAIDSEEDPEPFSGDELRDQDGPLGWWGMLVRYARMMGLKEHAVASAGVSSVTLFQPSNLVTKTIRYGWLDWILFKLLPFVDPIIPERYHSVPVCLLGMAMAGDAVEVLREDSYSPASGVNVTRMTYGDYLRIAGKEFEFQQEQEEAKEKLDGGSGRSEEQSDKDL